MALSGEAVGCCALPLGSPAGAGVVPCTVLTGKSAAVARRAQIPSRQSHARQVIGHAAQPSSTVVALAQQRACLHSRVYANVRGAAMRRKIFRVQQSAACFEGVMKSLETIQEHWTSYQPYA